MIDSKNIKNIYGYEKQKKEHYNAVIRTFKKLREEREKKARKSYQKWTKYLNPKEEENV